jgi:tetratricopeptide (TPR) repeat protein
MRGAIALPALLLASSLVAQPGAVVQPVPPAAAVETLNNNLAKLSRNPQDVEALLGAGQAALDLGDAQAANGFFTRANMVNPNLGRAKLGLGIVQLQLKQASDSAASFDAAASLGEPANGHLAERGLAYDLTGQQAKAQRDYQGALRADPDDLKAKLRYAVSLGISGKVAEADRLIEPVLAAGDREAWRLRAFIYAMNGRQGEARSITQAVMPKGLADALDPYMARVSLLTPAQKAAAAHFGDFPANVLRMAVPATPPAAPAIAPAPQLAETDRRESGSSNRRSRSQQTERASGAAGRSEPAPSASAPQPVASSPVSLARAPAPPPQPTPTPTPTLAPAARRPASVPPPAPTPERSLADAVLALTVPAAEKAPSGPSVDINDLKRLQEERAKKAAEDKAKAAAAAKAKAEAAEKKRLRDNPSRVFVQIAAGKRTSALAFDLDRFRKRYEAIGDEQGWRAEWGATNRLLIGPYRSTSKAQDVADSIKKAGGDAFVWTSDAGETVSRVSAR